MYLVDIKETFLDFPDNKSLSMLVFFAGCKHNCRGCQSPSLQKVENYTFFTKESVIDKISSFGELSRTDKIVLSGGDPFLFKDECMFVIDKLVGSGLEVCVYTGYTIDAINEFYKDSNYKKPLYLKCGKYEEEHKVQSGKTAEKFTLASTNQRFYKLIDNEYQQISKENVLFFN